MRREDQGRPEPGSEGEGAKPASDLHASHPGQEDNSPSPREFRPDISRAAALPAGLVPRRADRRDLARRWKIAEREHEVRRAEAVDRRLRQVVAGSIPLRSVVIDMAAGPRTTFRHADGTVVIVEGGGQGALDRIGARCRRAGARLESVVRLPRNRYWLRFRSSDGEGFAIFGRVISVVRPNSA